MLQTSKLPRAKSLKKKTALTSKCPNSSPIRSIQTKRRFGQSQQLTSPLPKHSSCTKRNIATKQSHTHQTNYTQISAHYKSFPFTLSRRVYQNQKNNTNQCTDIDGDNNLKRNKLDPTTNPLHQYSPNSFFTHIHSYTHQDTMYFDSAYGLTELARSLGQICQDPHIQANILLYGDLGTGKTTFSRYFLRELMNSPALSVVSPTFTLQVTYNHNKRVINHMDLYRLNHSNEAHILNLLDTYNDTLPDQTMKSTINLENENNINKLPSSVQPPHFTLPNTKRPHQAINLIEWPHILHNSRFMPQSYIRIDLQDKFTHKKVTISLHGAKYQHEYIDFNDKNNCDISSLSGVDSKTTEPVTKQFGRQIITKIHRDLGDLIKDKTYAESLTDAIYFGDDEGIDESGDECDNAPSSIPTFIPKQFTNHRL